jgi:two-component system response regulator ResD
VASLAGALAGAPGTVKGVSDRILLVEDEANIASFIGLYLQKAGYAVDRAANGKEGIERAGQVRPQLIVLDLNLPDMDGLEVCRTLRADSNVPILMLTARDDDVDKIVGLEVGADDYMTKPFNPRELVARIRSILRRSTAAPPKSKGRKEHGPLMIDAGRREVTMHGQPVQLAPKEFDLLWELLDHRGMVLTREQLLERVWGYTFVGDTRTVDVHVRQLRRKIGEDCPVVTVWGVGYKVADDAAPVA